MTTLPQDTIDLMVREASEVERGSANECVRDVCCHVRALAAEIERLKAQCEVLHNVIVLERINRGGSP